MGPPFHRGALRYFGPRGPHDSPLCQGMVADLRSLEDGQGCWDFKACLSGPPIQQFTSCSLVMAWLSLRMVSVPGVAWEEHISVKSAVLHVSPLPLV